MKLKQFIKIFLIIFINNGLLYCWSSGENVLSILYVPVSARSFSISGLNSIYEPDASNVSNNPAVLRNVIGSSFNFSHFIWFDGLNIETFVFTRKNIGFSYLMTKTEIDARDEKGNLLNKKGSFSSSVIIFAFSPFSFRGIDFGFGLKSATEKIEETKISSLFLDLSFSYLKYYVAIRNIGSRVEVGKKYPVPTSLNIGGEEKMGRFDFLYEATYRGERKLIYRAGFEFNSGIFSLRTGFKYLDFVDTFFGFGVRYKKFVFDYSFSPHPYLGLRQSFGLKFSF